MINVLYISYDGITDPLGQSQILPYLTGLSKKGYKFTIISAEKPEILAANRKYVEPLLAENNIDWHYISFTIKPPILAKFYDLYRLKKLALEVATNFKFDMVHCRSYISADVGLMLKKRFGFKFLFDMRGFWVDERVESGNWDTRKPIFKLAYKWYKQKEAAYIANADVIITLTEAAKKEIETWDSYKGAPIGVIPCCTDFDLFTLTNPVKKAAARQALNIPPDSLVISFLGSIGNWYLIDEMLIQFKAIKQDHPNAKFLFITFEPKKFILMVANRYALTPEDIIITAAPRHKVPFLLCASDINLFYIKQTYSKIASSPTKLGEVLAVGIPVICNGPVGNVTEVIDITGGGLVITTLNSECFDLVCQQISSLLNLQPKRIRERAFSFYHLGVGVSLYNKHYKIALTAEMLKHH